MKVPLFVSTLTNHAVLANHQNSPCFCGAIGMIEKIYEDGLKPSIRCATMTVRQLGI